MEMVSERDKQLIVWVKSFNSGQHWLLKLEKEYGAKFNTIKNYAEGLKKFCEYAKMNPDEIIEAYKAAIKADVNEAVEMWNDKLDLFIPWLTQKYEVKRITAASRFNAVKSFFSHNVAIPLTSKTPKFHADSYKPVTIDEIREKVLPHADVMQAFEILFLKDSGMSQEDALKLNVGDIEDVGNEFGYIKAFRGKEAVDYETFIGPNAVQAMKRVLEYRQRMGCEIKPESPLFVKLTKPNERQTDRLIASSWQRLSVKAGVIISTHRARKTFETFLAVGKVHPVILKYWMGHKVEKSDIEGKYIIPPKPDQLKLYMEAYKAIDVTPKKSEEETQVEAIANNARSLGIPEEKIQEELKQRGKTWVTPKEFARQIYRLQEKVIKPDELKKIEKEIRRQTQANGGDCGEEFEQIQESQLLSYLKAGWQIVHRLESGEVIVKR
jgi:site-specific recombinase XerD